VTAYRKFHFGRTQKWNTSTSHVSPHFEILHLQRDSPWLAVFFFLSVVPTKHAAYDSKFQSPFTLDRNVASNHIYSPSAGYIRTIVSHLRRWRDRRVKRRTFFIVLSSRVLVQEKTRVWFCCVSEGFLMPVKTKCWSLSPRVLVPKKRVSARSTDWARGMSRQVSWGHFFTIRYTNAHSSDQPEKNGNIPRNKDGYVWGRLKFMVTFSGCVFLDAIPGCQFLVQSVGLF